MKPSAVLAGKAAVVVVIGLFTGTVSGCSNSGGGSYSSSSQSASTGASPSVSGTAAAAGTVAGASSPLGTILADGQGRTLYLFEADTSTKSTCTGTCAAAWPPVTVTGTPAAGKGAKADLLGTTGRSGGEKQITYNGHPLYYFEGDTKAGDTNGQGSTAFGAAWYVLDTSGNSVTGKAQQTGGGY
ncbi:COG4315 family predicted lipoprotein [Streptomyces hirsutus]|uniref:COG4315 family predicted lipoprotein n=1 Tax=Streptomyces hirsutus TaxID=35620 RepID=UPI0036CCA1D9